MSYIGVLARVAQIQGDGTIIQTAFERREPASGRFADALAQAQASGSARPVASVASSSSTLAGTLTTGQQQFASRLSEETGLDQQVMGDGCSQRSPETAAQSRQAANNNDWLNIGYTDSGTYGSTDSLWGSPVSAAEATAGWLKGQHTIAGYGTASSGIQAILSAAGQPAQTQIAAIQQSGWASSGYPDLLTLYQQVAAYSRDAPQVGPRVSALQMCTSHQARAPVGKGARSGAPPAT